MSFAGSVLSMIVSLKNNARPKRKRFKGYNEHEKIPELKNLKLQTREIPDEEMKAIKHRIRMETKKDNRRFFLFTLVFGIFVLVFVVLLFNNFYQEQQIYEKLAPLKEAEKKRVLHEKFEYLLNDGYEYLERGRYHNAKFLFREASELIPGDYRAKFATLKAYIYDCKENKVNCYTAERMLRDCLSEYPEDRDVIELAGMLGN
jgi:tetratricopeptide (TPR) repeat protein